MEYMNEFRDLAEDLMSSIIQSRKSTIMVRKEQSELSKQSLNLAELLQLTQRDIEIAVIHTKNLIQKDD